MDLLSNLKKNKNLFFINIVIVIVIITLLASFYEKKEGESNFSKKTLEIYELKIKSKNLRKLNEYYQNIKSKEYLEKKDRKWFKAILLNNNEKFKIKFRVRGDLHTHWRGERKSIRIKFNDDKLIEGKKEINLIVPWDKDYGADIVINEIAMNMGLLTVETKFVHLNINNEYNGVFYMTEHPTKEMFERNGYGSTSLFSFGKNWTYYQDKRNIYYNNYYNQQIENGIMDNYFNIDHKNTFDVNNYFIESQNLSRIIYLHTILKNNLNNKKKLDLKNIINEDNFIKNIAISCFFGSNHALSLNDNTKIYLNKEKLLFELIPWDIALMDASQNNFCNSLLSKNDTEIANSNNDYFSIFYMNEKNKIQFHNEMQSMFKNKDYYKARIKEIHKILIENNEIHKKLDEVEIRFNENMKYLSNYYED